MTIALISLFLLLNLFDLIITDWNLRHGAVELNSDWQGMTRLTYPMVLYKVKLNTIVLISYFVWDMFYSNAIMLIVAGCIYYAYIDIKGIYGYQKFKRRRKK